MVRISGSMHSPPSGETPSDAERKFSGGPCHDLTRIKDLAKNLGAEALRLVTNRCSKSVASHELDLEDIVGMVLDLQANRFKGSEWCKASHKSPWFKCDAYVVTFEGENSDTGYSFEVEYYLKLHLKETQCQGPILIFSLHL